MSSSSHRRRLVVLGADGMDPGLLRQLLAEGKLPALARLARHGGPYDLATTLPCASPVAWSSFISGKNPGGHGIFDFLERDRLTYLPRLALSSVKKGLFGVPKVTSKRGGGAFWEEAGKRGLRTSLLFLPVTFPPPAIAGRVLTGLGTPDIRGSWGTYTLFSTRLEQAEETTMGGVLVPLRRGNGERLAGLEGPLGRTADVRFRPSERAGVPGVEIEVAGLALWVAEGAFSPWVDIPFSLFGPIRARGMARFYVVKAAGELEIYCSPVNMHPLGPPLPVSSPRSWSGEIFRRRGPFKTLGWDMDTWALEEGRLPPAAFLQDLRETVAARAAVVVDELRTGDWDLLVAVMQETDLASHVFWSRRTDGSALPEAREAVERTYGEFDRLVAAALACLGPDDVLFAISDHGFGSFHRSVNLNSFLREEGLLACQADASPVRVSSIAPGRRPEVATDWGRTRAYSYGLGNIWLNVRGREASGTVDEGRDYMRTREAIAEKLLALRDPVSGSQPVRSVYFREKVYGGQYFDNAPDLLVGFDEGYRVSWDTALGGVAPEIFGPNAGHWQGDHCSRDPAITPGVLLANRPLTAGSASILDLAPSILAAFGIGAPAGYEGKSLL